MKKIGLNYLLIAVFAIATVFTSCNKDNDYGNDNGGGGGGGGSTGKIIEDFPASFAKKLCENWDCSEWLKVYYSAQGFNGIETMHCINTADCATDFDINDMYEYLYEGGSNLLSSSSYNQNTKRVTIYYTTYRNIGSSWDYMAIVFYTIDVIK